MSDSPPPPELQTQPQYPLPTGKVLADFIEKALKDTEREKIRLAVMNPVPRREAIHRP